MCRYALSEYRTHFVCVPCRAVRKEWPHLSPDCTSCGNPMLDAGRDFHTPKRTDTRQWAKLELLFADGSFFERCGCNGPGPVPATANQVAAALDARETRRAGYTFEQAARLARAEAEGEHIPLFAQRRPASRTRTPATVG